MSKKKKKPVKEPKVKKQGKGKDFLVFIIIAFVMVFLTSFIVEDVYNYADRIVMTPEGVKEVYAASIGQSTFVEEVKEKNNSSTTTQKAQPTAEPTVTPEPTTAATPEATPEENPTPTPAENE